MYVEIQPLRVFMDGIPGQVYLLDLTEGESPSVCFLADDGVTYWNVTIDSFSLGTKIGNDVLSTFNLVPLESFQGEVKVEEFSSSLLRSKEIWIPTFQKRASYVRTYVLTSGPWVERVHLVETPAGNLALLQDMDALFGIEPEPPKREPAPKQFDREPIRTAGHNGANLLDTLGITLPEMDMS